jgi:hypothetical protein
MSPKHAAVDEAETPEPQPEPQPKPKFKSEYAPHLAMAVLFLTWIVFQIPAVNGGTAPQTINVAFAGTLGLWFPYLIREQTKGDNK